MTMISLTIDGTTLFAQENATILQAAKDAGIQIPTLCHHPRLTTIGSCGLCLVEIDGHTDPQQACSTPVTDGMVVNTKSHRLTIMRQDSLKLLLKNHPLDCPICDKAGDCRLQDLVFDLGVQLSDYQPCHRPKEEPYSTSLIRHWPDRCVLCLRCVTACKEIKGASALAVEERDGTSRITGYPDKCVHCGECLQVCPVGALTENLSPLKGRSFLSKKVRTTCTYCGCGCQMELNVADNQLVAITGIDDQSINKASLCVKGRFGYEFVASNERLKKPLIRRNGQLQESDWDEALRLVARNFSKIKKDNGPDAIGGLASARCTNEDNYLFQKFMRAVIGTNNVDHCARL